MGKNQVLKTLIPLFALTFMAFGIECIITVALLVGDIPLFIFLMLHLAITSAYHLLGSILEKKGFGDKRLIAFCSIFVMALGVFGAMTSTLMLALYVYRYNHQHSVSDLLDALWPQVIEDPSEVLFEKLQARQLDDDTDAGLTPFQDVMMFGSEVQKRNAIEKILRHYRPVFARALKLGTQDSSNAIRVLAAAAITRLEQQLAQRNIELEKNAYKRLATPEDILQYAIDTDNYSNCNILDENRAMKIRHRAIKAYREYLMSRPENKKVILALGKLCLQNKDLELAAKYFNTLIDNWCLEAEEASLWMMRLQYDQKDFHAVRTRAKALNQDLKRLEEYGDIIEIVKLWAKDEEEVLNGV